MRESIKIAIVGAGGRLGAALEREYRGTGDVQAFAHKELDLRDQKGVREKLGVCEFDVLINAAAQTNVDRCETERAEAFALNAEAPRLLAEICQARGARFIHISTDYVFDGDKREPYREEDAAKPLSVYGESKLEGERQVLAIDANYLVVRVAWVFGPDRPSFIDWVVQRAREHARVEAVADKFSTPTYTLDIAEMLRPFLSSRHGLAPEKPETCAPALAVPRADRLHSGGVLHITNRGQCSWQEYGQWALDCCRAAGVALRAREVGAISLREMKNFIARRPVYTVLATEKYEQLTGQPPRDWREAVADYIRAHVAPVYRSGEVRDV